MDQPASPEREAAVQAVEDLADRVPTAHSRPIIETALALTDDLTSLRFLRWHAGRVAAYELALELFDRIPPTARLPEDELDRAYALCALGRFAAAQVALEAVDTTELDAHERLLHTLNLVPACLLQDGPFSPAQLAAFEAKLDDATRLLRSDGVKRKADNAWRTKYRATIAQTRALCAIHRGDADAALQAARAAFELDATSPWIAATLAFASTGDAADEAWTQCRELAHPESYLAKQATSHLGGVHR